MPNRLIDTPQALDAAIEASVQSRRESLLRAARGEGMRLAEVLAGLVALLAIAEFFVEPKRAGYAAFIACLSIGSVYVSRKARQKKAIRELREMEKST
jgi:hypothetical protein